MSASVGSAKVREYSVFAATAAVSARREFVQLSCVTSAAMAPVPAKRE